MINSTPSSQHSNRPLIVFGEDWGAHPSSTQHLIKVLAKTRSVIWLNSIGLRKPKFTLHDFKRAFTKVKSFLLKVGSQQKNTEQAHSEFIIINPLVFPCANNFFSLSLSKCILRWQLRKVAKDIDITDAIIWSSLPTSVDYLDIFGKSPCVYYCGDDFNSLAGVDHQIVCEKEQRLITKSQYIFTASKKLLSKFPTDKVVNIPHGVNFSLFSKYRVQTPCDLPQGRPIAGFYGSISTWLDQDLLVKAITALPHWNFVFVGNIECNIDKILPFSNVYFIGAKPHEELPNYIQNWDVAMLPFVDNKQIQMCNPLKLREYLASGTPVVTTNFNALDGYRNYLQVANEQLPFEQAILLAHAEITPAVNFEQLESINDLLKITEVKNARKHLVCHESWESRASDVQRYLVMC
jgi:glycosyltransferase involved in cell wall biosynthesis